MVNDMVNDKTILVGVDGSHASYKATWWAANYAKHVGLSLQIVCAYSLPSYAAVSFDATYTAMGDYNAAHAGAQEILSKAKAIPDEQGVDAPTAIGSDDTKWGIRALQVAADFTNCSCAELDVITVVPSNTNLEDADVRHQFEEALQGHMVGRELRQARRAFAADRLCVFAAELRRCLVRRHVHRDGGRQRGARRRSGDPVEGQGDRGRAGRGRADAAPTLRRSCRRPRRSRTSRAWTRRR